MSAERREFLPFLARWSAATWEVSLHCFLCFLSLWPLLRDVFPEWEGWTCPLTAVAGSQPSPAASPPSRGSLELRGLAVLREKASHRALRARLPAALPGGSAFASEREAGTFPALSPVCGGGRGRCRPPWPFLSGGSAQGGGSVLRTDFWAVALLALYGCATKKFCFLW